MQAVLVTHFKDRTPEGGVIELVVWRLPQPVSPATHGYKYRAAYAVGGVRVVGFDNERGKGDHCNIERPYAFTTVEQLVEDFIAAVAAARSTPWPNEPSRSLSMPTGGRRCARQAVLRQPIPIKASS